MILRQQESLFSTDSDSFQLKFNSNGDQDKPIITFEIDYSSIRIKNFLIPDNIDKLWNIIGSSSSYSRIYQTILDLDSDTIFSIFDNFNTSPFKQEFFELVEYASLIFPPEFVEIYLSQPKLDIELLIKQLPINSRALFCSYIQLVKIILQKFFDYSQKQIIVHKLANFLIPVNLPRKRDTLEYILFLPVMSESRMCWLIYCRDSSLIINNPGSTSQKFSKGQFSLIGDSICTNNGFTTLKYSFFSVDEFSLFHTADFSEDPLDTFIQSFKFAQSYVNEIPKIIISQIYKIMGESDFALARALFSIPKVNLTKEVALSIFKILWESGSFTTFMRFIFHQEIQALPDATTIFRGTNPATFSASTLSSLFSEAYCNMIISKISKKPDSLLNAVNSIINSCKNLPITLQFLYSTVFRVTRRRFPHNLTPVVAVSSIFMLRMILPRISTSEVSPIGKKLMNAFAFHDKASSLKEHPIYTKIFKFVVNLTKMKPSSINFPAHNLSALVDFISQEEEKIMEIYKSFNFTNNEDVNPLTPTMIEIIENCFIGSDEDLETLMNVYKIFP